MFKIFKTLFGMYFLSLLGRSTGSADPIHLGRVMSADPIVTPWNPNELFGDLPRLINPKGEDDTHIIINRIIMPAFPEFSYCPDQRVNLRKLYMAIHMVRQTEDGWGRDNQVLRGEYAQDMRRKRKHESHDSRLH